MTDTSLLGRAKELEVAGILIRNGVYVFWPLVDKGIDLLATNNRASRFVPVQVRYRRTGPALDLHEGEIERLLESNAVVAFLRGDANDQHQWFVPISAWRTKAVDKKRADGMVYVSIKRNVEWLEKFRGDSGVRTAFHSLLVD